MKPAGKIILTTFIIVLFLAGAAGLVLFVRADWRSGVVSFFSKIISADEGNMLIEDGDEVVIEHVGAEPGENLTEEEKVKQQELRAEDYNECFFLSETAAACEYKTYTFLKEYDSDQDALNAAYEKMLGTDPDKKDTDGDGTPDGLEMARRTSPTDPLNIKPWGFAELPKEYQQSDKDYDGLRDEWEELFGLDKGNADTDGDGYLDGEEIIRGFNPKGDGGAVYEAKTTLEWVREHRAILETTTVLWKLP